MITADDIKSKAFEVEKSGYSQSEVDAFLDEISETISKLNQERADYEQKVIKLVEKINEYREDEEAIKSALLTAQKEANRILKDAKEKSEEMIENAKSEQQKITEQSAYECDRIVREHKEKCAKLITENTEITERKISKIKKAYNDQKTKLENLKVEVTYFKAQLTSLYNKQLHLIMDIPEITDEEIAAIEQAAEKEKSQSKDKTIIIPQKKPEALNTNPQKVEQNVKTVIQENKSDEKADTAEQSDDETISVPTQNDIAKAIEEKKKLETTAKLDKILNTVQIETPKTDTSKFGNLKFGHKS